MQYRLIKNYTQGEYISKVYEIKDFHDPFKISATYRVEVKSIHGELFFLNDSVDYEDDAHHIAITQLDEVEQFYDDDYSVIDLDQPRMAF